MVGGYDLPEIQMCTQRYISWSIIHTQEYIISAEISIGITLGLLSFYNSCQKQYSREFYIDWFDNLPQIRKSASQGSSQLLYWVKEKDLRKQYRKNTIFECDVIIWDI